MKKKVLLLTALVLMLLGAGAGYGGRFALGFVHDQLAEQKIFFSDKATLQKENSALVKYAGGQVDTGPEAKAYSEYIHGHLAKIAGGKTYAEVSTAYQKDKTNTALAGQRQSLFMGETLRGILLSAWGWSLVGMVALYAGITLLGLALIVLVYALLVHGKPAAKKKR